MNELSRILGRLHLKSSEINRLGRTESQNPPLDWL